MHEWSYSNDFDPAGRRLMPHVDLKERFKKLDIEVELGFTVEQATQEVERCLNCDIQTVFTAKLCIECDACIDICPVNCLTITHNGDEADLQNTIIRAGGQPGAGAVRFGRLAANVQSHGEGRGSLRALRPVRRALPDRCVGHAESLQVLIPQDGR